MRIRALLGGDRRICAEGVLGLGGHAMTLSHGMTTESYSFELDKRSRFQYNMLEETKKSKAETSLKRAKEFVFEMKKLLIRNKR